MNELVWSEKWPTVEGWYHMRTKRERDPSWFGLISDWDIKSRSIEEDMGGYGFEFLEFAGPIHIPTPKEPGE